MTIHRMSGDRTAARVQRVDRGLVTLLVEGAPLRASLGGDMLDRIAHDPAATPCAGDWCELRRWPDGPLTVERVRPRGPSLTWPDLGGTPRRQLLAANLDLVLIVVAPVPDPVTSPVERLLALATASGAQPLVVLTGTDLVPDGGSAAREVARLVGRVAPDVRVLVAGGTAGQGLEELRRAVDGGTAAVLGTEDSGKSALVEALAGSPVLRTAGGRAAGRGPHPPARCELVQLPGGGALIDTPALCGTGLHERQGRGGA